MKRKRLIGSIAAACAAAALTAGIAEGSGTSQGTTSTQTSSTSAASGTPGHGAPGGGAPGLGGGPGGGAVHSVSVVLNKARTAFVTQTSDRGTVESVDASAGTVTILEGTKSVTYKTVTVTIPSTASVSLDGKTSTLSALVKGDRVSVSSSSDGTDVIAMDSSFRPEGGPGGGGAKGQMPPGESSSSSGSTSGATSGTTGTTTG
jgi:hypothetical protein